MGKPFMGRPSMGKQDNYDQRVARVDHSDLSTYRTTGLIKPERRVFMNRAASAGVAAFSLSASAIALLAGCSGDEREETALEDGEALNKILEVEFKVVEGYNFILDIGTLNPSSERLAKDFRDDHRRHISDLRATIKFLQVDPEKPKRRQEYGFDPKRGESIVEALKFFTELEQEIVFLYLEGMQGIKDPNTVQKAASIYGVEAMHWAVLRSWLNEKPIPDSTLK